MLHLVKLMRNKAHRGCWLLEGELTLTHLLQVRCLHSEVCLRAKYF